MNNSVGIKIKNFRQRANLSQADLEFEINTSAGSISRMENGVVNPTNETLNKIASVLKLNNREKLSLLSKISFHPSNQEIRDAVKEVDELFSRDGIIAYLFDDRLTLHKFSTGLRKAFGLTEEIVNKCIGANMMEVYFDPRYGVRKIFDSNYFIENMAIELARSKEEGMIDINDPEHIEYLKPLMQFDEFRKAFELSSSIPNHKLFPSHRIGHVIVGDKKYKVQYSRDPLKSNPRFEVIEFFNFRPYE